jgi:retron-type reverse transcriptase
MAEEPGMTCFEKIASSENLFDAFLKARKGKGRSAAVSSFDFNFDKLLWEIQEELSRKTYRPGAYASFRIRHPKPRLITAAPFRDRVVHHALCNVIVPLFEQRFLPCSHANRRGFGTHRAFRVVKSFFRQYRF